MSRQPQPFDTVAMLRDYPDRAVSRGDIGTVVEIHADGALEVEFVQEDGSPRALFAVPREDCLPVNLGAADAAMTGVVDGSLWYWYDPAADLLDVRLVSKRSLPADPEPTADGSTLLRDPRDHSAVGLIVRGFWSRFGGGAERPDRTRLEQRVGGLADRLAA